MKNDRGQLRGPKTSLFWVGLVTLICGVKLLASASQGSFDPHLESGLVWQNRNGVRISPNSGTY